MAASVLSLSAFAKETIKFDSGLVLEIYDSSRESTPVAAQANMNTDSIRSANSTISLTIPKYPDSVYMRNSSNSYNLSLGNSLSAFYAEFGQSSPFQYFSLYDVTSGTYLAGSGSDLYYVGHTGDTYKWSGLTGGHTYRIKLSNSSSAKAVTYTLAPLYN